MFFRKKAPPSEPSSPPKLTAIDGGAPRTRPAVTPPLGMSALSTAGPADAGDTVAPVLDALGSILAAFARHAFDLPEQSAEETQRLLLAFQRHATLGVPLAGSDGNAVGIGAREWNAVVRAFTDHRRTEARYVASTVPELRDALWEVVESVHKAVQVDRASDRVADAQVQRARTAITRLEAGAIRQEVLGALSALEEAFRARQAAHREEYATLAAHIERLGTQLEEARKESTTDPLTGLGNRKLFDVMVGRALHLHVLSGQPVTLVMIDLDRLKQVNDMYGHQAGDAAITGVAGCLAKVFMRQTDVLCRFGGDEFAAVLTNTDVKTAKTLATRLHEQIARMPSPNPAMEFAVGASVGIAAYDGSESVDAWVARADKALYQAKQAAGERTVVGEG